MKLFHPKSGYYGLTVYHILKAPYEAEHPIGTMLARRMCEDACFLSNGSGSVSVELLRIARKTAGKGICHLLVLRCWDKSRDVCAQLGYALRNSVAGLLHSEGYRFVELPFDRFAALHQAMDRTTVWAIAREELRENEAMSPTHYVSLPVFADKMELQDLYTALDGSGCCLSVQIIPNVLLPGELQLIRQRYADYSRAAEGTVVPGQLPRDSMAAFARRRWEYYARSAATPMALLNVTVSGPAVEAAVVVSRLKSCLKDADTESPALVRSFNITAEYPTQIYDLPWRCEKVMAAQCSRAGYSLAQTPGGQTLLRKYTAAEAGAVMELPVGDEYNLGVGRNAFSLLRKGTMLPEQMTVSGDDRLHLGITENGAGLQLMLEDLLLHCAVYGKSGMGKTTLLMSMIRQLTEKGVNVLVLEPVKREYRSLIHNGAARVFTVESPVVPFVTNPFLVPRGITLREYRPHLLSAFTAAFSMPDPLPSLFGTAITQAYALHGWKDSSRTADADVRQFGLWEFVQVFRRVVENSGYSGEVKGNMSSGGTFRLLSLIDRCKNTFETVSSVDVEELLTGQVVLELGGLEGEAKCLVAALTLIGTVSYLRTTRSGENRLRNVILLDEAHVLLDNGQTRTEEGKAAGQAMSDLICNLVAEMRALGCGIILADQSPNRIGQNLLDNTDNRIVFRLTGKEARTVAEGIGLNQREERVLPLLDRGEAILTNHRLTAPLGFTTVPQQSCGAISDRQLEQYSGPYLRANAKRYRPFRQCAACPVCREDCDGSVRELACVLSIQFCCDRSGHIKTREDLLRHLLRVPAVLRDLGYGQDPRFLRLCGCCALQMYRRAALEGKLAVDDAVLEQYLGHIHNSISEKTEEKNE